VGPRPRRIEGKRFLTTTEGCLIMKLIYELSSNGRDADFA